MKIGFIGFVLIVILRVASSARRNDLYDSLVAGC